MRLKPTGRMAFSVLVLSAVVFQAGGLASAAPPATTKPSAASEDVRLRWRASQAAAADAEIPPRVARLVGGLGDADYRARERAQESLKHLGIGAIPALREAARAGDLEIRYRAKRVLTELEPMVREERLSLFLETPEASECAFIPGVKRYSEEIGTDRHARELFVLMHRSVPELFAASESGDLQAEFEKHSAELNYKFSRTRERESIVSSVSALLFLGSDPEVTVTDRSGTTLTKLVKYREFSHALLRGSFSQSTRKLLTAWIAKEGYEQLYEKTVLSMMYDIPRGIVPALKALEREKSGAELEYALLAVGRFGHAEHIARVKPLFDDGTNIRVARRNGRIRYSCQVRDAALAVAYHLSGEDPSDFGFDRLREHPKWLYRPGSSGFDHPAEREAAFEKWSRWKAAQNEDTEVDRAASP